MIAPGEVVGVDDSASGFEGVEGWTVSFPPEVLGSRAPGAFLSWRVHPLLFPFVGDAAGGAQRLKVPAGDRPLWSGRFSALDVELHRRRDGYREAVLSHLTLLLVEVSRLAADVVRDLRLKDVARAVGLTPGYLTTVVGRKTGRTVVEWISERRMAEARRLLVETNLSVDEVGRRVGYGSPSYFVRHFRRAHRSPPLGWRRAGRPYRPAPGCVFRLAVRRDANPAELRSDPMARCPTPDAYCSSFLRLSSR